MSASFTDVINQDYISLSCFDDDDADKTKKSVNGINSNNSNSNSNSNNSNSNDVAKLMTNLHQDILLFANAMRPTPAEHRMRKSIVSSIEECALSLWPDAHVFVFGSFYTSLYLPQGDIDICIKCPSWAETSVYNHGFSKHGTSRVSGPMRQMERILRKRGLTTEMQLIKHARVPIIKCKIESCPVDISFSVDGNMDMLHSGDMILAFSAERPEFFPLVILLKHFLLQNSLNEPFNGGLGSFSLLLMVISFLQLSPRAESSDVNLGVLLIEFFELYGMTFNYKKVAISVRNGGRYFPKSKGKWGGLLNGQTPGQLSIENPFDITQDVSRSSYKMFAVQKMFRDTYAAMYCSIFDASCGKNTDSKGSMLSELIRVTPSLLDFRKQVQAKWGLAEDAAVAEEAFNIHQKNCGISYHGVCCSEPIKYDKSGNTVDGIATTPPSRAEKKKQRSRTVASTTPKKKKEKSSKFKTVDEKLSRKAKKLAKKQSAGKTRKS